ncbi:FAD-dependent oxidoreductase [Candidatus Woesearchaeota archaeon]|nr:FAD-dependent oxidoreductase [Candidatus Woesearchaeota archaeon]
MKVIAIIGGGFCGAQCAKILDKKIPITNYKILLFDKKDYFQYTPSIHKILTNKYYESKIKIPYSHFLKNTNIIQEEVISITKKTIKTKNKKYSFDYLVLASGAHTAKPIMNGVHVLKTIEDAHNIRKILEKTNNAVIVGGGYTGTEVAGELSTKTDKHIVIIQYTSRLLERQYEGASLLAFEYLTKKGVKIYFNQKAEHFQGKHLHTSGGEMLYSDCVIWCTGIKPNTQFLKGFSSHLTKKGYIKTTLTLNLKNNPNIFVGGDLTDLPEEKSAQNAEYHGQIIAKNILNLANKKKLLTYKPGNRLMVISLGDWYSIITYNEFAWGGLLGAALKKIIEKAIVWKYKYW